MRARVRKGCGFGGIGVSKWHESKGLGRAAVGPCPSPRRSGPHGTAATRCPHLVQSLANTLNVVRRRLYQLQTEGIHTQEDLQHYKASMAACAGMA